MVYDISLQSTQITRQRKLTMQVQGLLFPMDRIVHTMTFLTTSCGAMPRTKNIFEGPPRGIKHDNLLLLKWILYQRVKSHFIAGVNEWMAEVGSFITK